MVRKLVLSLLSLMVLVPMSGWGLGLGDIRLNSFLNQPLDAEIELLSVQDADVETMTVKLASFETFARFGLERPASLMFLKFSLKKGADGRYIIKVSSKNPVREPFLNFLLDVEWRSGRQLREYTLLLDPPEMMKQQGAPATTTPIAATTATDATAQKAPVSARSAPAYTGTSTTRSAPSPAYTPTAGELVYGPVKSDDTLWSIARRMRPSSDISVNQMMMAIHQANPDAFLGGNINRLKKGKVLRVDDPALLRAMSHAEASREVKRQDREWQDYKQMAAEGAAKRVTGMAPMQEAPAVAAADDARLELVAPVKGEQEEATGAGGEGTADSGLQNELMMAMESVEATSRQNEELKVRLQELEEQVGSMERLLTLKNDDLAALQQQLQEQGVEPALLEPEEPLVEPEVAVAPEEVATEETEAEMVEAADAVDEDAEALVGEVEEEAAPMAPEPEEPKPVVKPTPPPSLIDDLLGNQMVVIGGGVLVVMLLILGMIMVRRRRQGSFQESILSGGTSSMLKASEEGDASSQTSFLSDLTVSGMGEGAGDEGEVDPLTEADVYMAYGRYQQAEELLKDAIAKAPRRHELVVKLLELYHSTKNAESFSSVAEDSQSALQDNEAHWNKVLAMGYELAPDNPLFAAGADVEGAVGSEGGEATSDDVLDIGLDLDALTEEMESAGEVGGDEFEFDLGLDLGDVDEATEDETVAEEPAESVEALSETLDKTPPGAEDSFELDFSAIGEEGSVEEETVTAASEEPRTEDDANSVDFDLDFELSTDISTEADAEVAADLENSLDFEPSDLELPKAEAASDDSESASDLDMSDLNFDDLNLDETTADNTSIADAEVSSDVLADLGDLGDELGGGDEVSTKLDLARAYVEMGDEDGAREMLEEVVEDGNDEQKKEAQELIQKLS